MTTSEHWVQDKIRDLLYCRGIHTRKVHGTTLNAGYPDLFAGRFWIEVKAPGKKLRPSQVEWFEEFIPQGVVAYVCDDHRQLWEILGTPIGSAPSNWREFMPRVHHRKRMTDALGAWATRPSSA